MKSSAALFLPHWLLTVLITVLILAGGALAADANAQDVLYRFQGGGDGENPTSNLVGDQYGNFYGTTEYGGVNGYYGTVFELTPPNKPGGAWTKTTLYSFANDGDGARPTAGLVFDHSGNLYGTTSDSNAGGDGNVFELSPSASPGGGWTETVLYSFHGNTDGADPYGGLIFDQAGNLYGTTESSVFELSPPANAAGAWSLTVLHDFTCCTSDGWDSEAGLVMDKSGNLYGTTELGGFYKSDYCAYLGCGTVFEVSPPAVSGGAWTEQVLHAFQGNADGFDLFGPVTLDNSGNLYGTTYSGGSGGGGIVFRLAPPAEPGGSWTKTELHGFSYTKSDGAVPRGSLIFDTAGNLYGTTEFGGNPCIFNTTPYGCGIVFQLTPRIQGAWTETVLYFLPLTLKSPKNPEAGLVMDRAGNLYGTTTYGGFNICDGDDSDGCGTVFEITR
jgi:uncharacterized repeat protein (TIGR03803 family)